MIHCSDTIFCCGNCFECTFSMELLKPEPNPMVRAHGSGPEGEKCKHCLHLRRLETYRRNYYKCLKYKLTHGPGSDMRLKWKACRLFEKEEES